jgi:hypothetical protein
VFRAILSHSNDSTLGIDIGRDNLRVNSYANLGSSRQGKFHTSIVIMPMQNLTGCTSVAPKMKYLISLVFNYLFTYCYLQEILKSTKIHKMEKRRLSGTIMAFVGFCLIVVDGLSYIFDWDLQSPILLILGLVFVVIGMRSVRRSKKKDQ